MSHIKWLLSGWLEGGEKKGQAGRKWGGGKRGNTREVGPLGLCPDPFARLCTPTQLLRMWVPRSLPSSPWKVPLSVGTQRAQESPAASDAAGGSASS